MRVLHTANLRAKSPLGAANSLSELKEKRTEAKRQARAREIVEKFESVGETFIRSNGSKCDHAADKWDKVVLDAKKASLLSLSQVAGALASPLLLVAGMVERPTTSGVVQMENRRIKSLDAEVKESVSMSQFGLSSYTASYQMRTLDDGAKEYNFSTNGNSSEAETVIERNGVLTYTKKETELQARPQEI